jgi:ssDNA-binding Zn-finger/Zn-ribbon topoisomerase 1
LTSYEDVLDIKQLIKLESAMKSKNILYSIARTPAGELIKAVNAKKAVSYVCPACSQSLILRKGTHKRPHFSHKFLSPNCTPETALHHGFKTLLFSRIEEHIFRNLPLEMQWDCPNCGGEHRGNLLKKAVSVRLEYNLGLCKPDIALLDSCNRTVAVIEIIVTHAPEQKALDYYEANRIAVVSYELESDEDIKRLDAPILKPDNVTVCSNPKCSKCNNHLSKKYILIIDANCWNCRSPMKVAALRGDMEYIDQGDFSSSDIQIASQYGVLMKSHYSRTAERKYVASTCRKCGAFCGKHYLFTDYIANPYYSCQKLDVGYYCPYCSESFE